MWLKIKTAAIASFLIISVGVAIALAVLSRSAQAQSANPLRPFFLNIAGAATTVIKTSPGVLERIVVNKAVLSGVITIYDNTAASGTKIATITHPATLLHTQISLIYGNRFDTGLTIVTSAADDITVIFR